MGKASAKFMIIHAALQEEDNQLDIQTMCQLVGVSRSGYYRWLNASQYRAELEEQDCRDFELILQAYNHRGYKKGARSIYMRLLHLNPPVVMNIKKIRRIMEKYRLYCPIRKVNPYRKMMQAMHTSHVSPNLVNREFTTSGPRTVLLTDSRTYHITVCSAICQQYSMPAPDRFSPIH